MQETDVKNKNRALGALLFPAAGLLGKKKKRERSCLGSEQGADSKDAPQALMKYTPRER